MYERLKIGLVGCGGHMFNYIYNYLRSLPVELAAICDKDEQRMKDFASYYKVDRLYGNHVDMLENEELDAVLCVADAATHYQVAKDTMLSGANVFIEKTPCSGDDFRTAKIVDIFGYTCY